MQLGSLERKRAIVNAFEQYDITESGAWNKLDQLSSHTHVDAIEVDPEGIILEKDQGFSGVANIYVSLEYGSKRDGFKTSDSFLGRFKGRFDSEGRPQIEQFSVDTSSFYE